MKVSDVMQKHVEFVTPETKVVDVARIIFGRRINGLPVCKNKKIVGFISERDILSKFHPTMQEFSEDPFMSANFEKMEEKAQEILGLKAQDIMSKNPITIKADDPILKADSMMKIKDVGRLPVVDKRGNLVGIIATGDIFKSLVGRKMPYLESEEYHDWIAKHFDLAIGWEDRIPSEIPALSGLFHKKEIRKILDIGCGTGEHAIALAKNGFQVLGLENSPMMFEIAQGKWKMLSKDLRAKVKFIKGDYVKNLEKIKEEYQGAMFMGNALAHISQTYNEVLKELNSILVKKNSVIVAQLINFDKAINVNNKLFRFAIQQSKLSPLWKHGYIWFYDPPVKEGDLLTLNAGILDFDGQRWSVRGMNSVKTIGFTRSNLNNLFKNVNFSKVSFYGSSKEEPLFKNEFDIRKSDWLTVVAERQ
jgi:CBS domain-containing protein/cyclopropane fatty-acyl-phospholipid synthase-like methyltransferase